MSKESKPRTPAQKKALERGMEIRQLRGLIANLKRFELAHPGMKSVTNCIGDLLVYHDKTYGMVKCYLCGAPSPYLQTICDECRRTI